MLVKNSSFGQKNQIWSTKKSTFGQQKNQILVKNSNFGETIRFWPKIQTLGKQKSNFIQNSNFGQKKLGRHLNSG